MKFFRRIARNLRDSLTPIRFSNQPESLEIKRPRTIRGSERMTVGNHVFIGPECNIRAVTKTGRSTQHPDGGHAEQTFTPKIVIGDRVSITSRLQLAAYKEVTIEEDVLIASNVFISDALHAYGRVDVPYRYQGFTGVSPIRIRRGCWIGQNVVIMPGVTVGEMSIVGANSVVTRSIPDRCIAVGAPARVIKRWDEEARCWVSVGLSHERGGPLDGVCSRP